MNNDVVHGINEQDAQLLQNMIEGPDEVLKEENKKI
jgi:hypothetical protein